MKSKPVSFGNAVAPWRFVAFLALALVAGGVLIPSIGWRQGAMAGFDIGALAFIVLCAPMFRHEPDQMRQMAQSNGGNRALLLALTAVVSGVVMVAVASVLMQSGARKPLTIALVIGTLALSWLFSNLVYALHYAHIFYESGKGERDCGGVEIPGAPEPDYWDFLYFSTCLGMTFQTSDVEITSHGMRRTAMFHSLAAFVFNIGVIAFSINVLGGGQ
jgi:uncharacterized membrane protein